MYNTTLQLEGISGTNTYWHVAVTMDNLTVLDWGYIGMKKEQMFGKLG
jgi:hypothetical protein